jgi:hypothetical protein
VQGRDCISVVVDRLTKFAHFFAIPTDYKAIQVAELFFREVFQLHGLPRQIVSDRDGRFINAFWQELFRLTGTELATSTSYHPQTDGQTEFINKWVEWYLRNYVGGQQRTWVRWLHMGEYCYNTTYHMSIRMPPLGIVWIRCTLLYRYCVWGQQGPRGQGLGGGESKDPAINKGELVVSSESAEDICRSTQS